MIKEIKIRSLTEEDNEMLDTLRRLTGKGHNSQAVLSACYSLLKYEKEIDEYRRIIAEYEGKINRFEMLLKEYFSAESNLRDMISN